MVPTYRRTQLLAKCLRALLSQDLPPEAYEVIVVDDGDSEETRQVVEQAARQGRLPPAVHYAAARETQGPAAARNLGWRLARGEVIAFTDDDCLPEPGWLKEGLAALAEDLDGACGQVIVPLSGAPTDYEKNVARLETCEFVTANCFYRRAALEACGGFDERFTTAWREDSDLQFRLLSLGRRLGSAPAARVVHPARPAPWGVSLREQRKSMFDALLYKNHPEQYRARVGAGPPRRYYAIILASLAAVAAALGGHGLLALLLAGLWAGLVLHFALVRLGGTRRTLSHVLEMLVTSMVIPYLSVFWRLYGAVYYRVWFF